jgi:hypothetical protein
MSTILDIVGSALIGGLLLLSILRLNLSYTSSSYSQQADLAIQTNLKTVTDIIDNDFRKIGYRATGTKIIRADTSSIVFWADIDNNGSVDSVRYFLSNTAAVSGTVNPNDRILYGLANNQAAEGGNMGVIRFFLIYYDSSNAVTSNLNAIKSIKVQLSVQSPSQIGGQYSSAYWEGLYRPRNL